MQLKYFSAKNMIVRDHMDMSYPSTDYYIRA